MLHLHVLFSCLAQNYHIVLADDDPDDRLIIREAIEDFSGNITLSEVADGRQLVEFFQARLDSGEKPDVIILDINMPSLDGVDALKILRDLGLAEGIPVYVLSTMRNRERVDQAKRLGVTATHSKPNTMKGFHELVQEIIQNSLQ